MDFIRNLTKNRFIFSSGIVFAGSTLANAVNYLYNLILGRILEPAQYGEVAAYVTLAMIIVVPSMTLGILVTKYISEHAALNQPEHVLRIYKASVRMASILGLGTFLIFLALSPFISSYLKTTLAPTIVFAVLMPLSLFASTNKGALQGLHFFSSLSAMSVIEAVGKLVFAVLFVYVGWGVAGAVGGILAGSFIAYAFSSIMLRKRLPAGVTTLPDNRSVVGLFKNIPGYVYVVFFSTLFLSIFGNIDVVMAKHYLSEHDAGQYAALAVLGRIVTYASAAAITVLLPMAAAARVSKDEKKSRKLLVAALGVTGLVSAFILIFFIFIPEYTISILFGREYLEVAGYLGMFGLIMLLGSLSKVFINYFLAIHEHKFLVPFGIISLMQVIVIFLYHETIREIINVLLLTNILLLIIMVVIYLFSPKNVITEDPLITNPDNA